MFQDRIPGGRSSVSLVAAGLALGLAACSGDDESGSPDAGNVGPVCSVFTACGGDIVGEWSFADVCAESSGSPIETCPESRADYSGMMIAGTVNFIDDGTYSLHYVTSGQVVISVPESCVSGAPACESLSTADRVCTAEGMSCTCLSPLEGEVEVTGSWATTGDILVLDGMDMSGYCVESGALAVQQMQDDGLAVQYTLTQR